VISTKHVRAQYILTKYREMRIAEVVSSRRPMVMISAHLEGILKRLQSDCKCDKQPRQPSAHSHPLSREEKRLNYLGHITIVKMICAKYFFILLHTRACCSATTTVTGWERKWGGEMRVYMSREINITKKVQDTEK
jgi:hypothetical protein